MWTHHLHSLQLSRNPSKLYAFNPLILTQYFTRQQTRLRTGNNPASPKLLSQFMVLVKIENLMARLILKFTFMFVWKVSTSSKGPTESFARIIGIPLETNILTLNFDFKQEMNRMCVSHIWPFSQFYGNKLWRRDNLRARLTPDRPPVAPTSYSTTASTTVLSYSTTALAYSTTALAYSTTALA